MQFRIAEWKQLSKAQQAEAMGFRTMTGAVVPKEKWQMNGFCLLAGEKPIAILTVEYSGELFFLRRMHSQGFGAQRAFYKLANRTPMEELAIRAFRWGIEKRAKKLIMVGLGRQGARFVKRVIAKMVGKEGNLLKNMIPKPIDVAALQKREREKLRARKKLKKPRQRPVKKRKPGKP